MGFNYNEINKSFLQNIQTAVKKKQWNKLAETKTDPQKWAKKFVEVNIVGDSSWGEANYDLIQSDWVIENKQIAQHIYLYKAFKYMKFDKHKLKFMREPLMKNGLVTLNRMQRDIELQKKLDVGVEQLEPRMQYLAERKSNRGCLFVLNEVIIEERIALNTFYRTSIHNVLDAHYIFNEIHCTRDYYLNAETILQSLAAKLKLELPEPLVLKRKKSVRGGGEADLGETKAEQHKLGLMRKEIMEMRNALKVWKNNKFIPDAEFIQRKRKIYKLKWRQHQEEIKRKALKKRAGRKKQEALMEKKRRLKEKGI